LKTFQAADAGIEPFFDFVVGFSGKPVSEDTDLFSRAVEQAENRAIVLQIWSSKKQELRDVPVIPSRSWSAASTSHSPTEPLPEPSLLGLSLRLCNPDGALERVWHVLDILEGSPAQDAGLVPFTDYIVGCPVGVLRTEGDFYDLVESHVDKPLRLFCWNADFDVLRQVIIVPNRNWGDGRSLLGCGIGFGLLHRIPKPQDRPAVFEENDLPEDGLEAEVEEVDEYAATEGVSVVAVGDDDEPANVGLRPQPIKPPPTRTISPGRRTSTPLPASIAEEE